MYVDSTADYTRASEKMLGVDITDIPAGDTVRMQMAVDMADILVGGKLLNIISLSTL